MASLLISIALLGLFPPCPASARPAAPARAMFAAHYAPGVMQQVAKHRGMAFQRCGVALDHAPLGSLVRVQGVRTQRSRSCTVYDYSHPRDRARHLRASLVELDHASARDICGAVYYLSRPSECPVLVTVLHGVTQHEATDRL